jgi:hypothetical protein
MYQDELTVKLRYEKFVKRICETAIVYGLESEEGFATSGSNEYDDENGEPVEIICFWPEKALAKACIKDDWTEYQVTEIPLSEFIENWCIGMNNDGLLIGTDFDQNMFGFETEPLDLALELVKKLKTNGSSIAFQKFESLEELEQQISGANT